MKQVKKEFFANGVSSGKRTLLFNLYKQNSKDWKNMDMSQKLLAISFLEGCKATVQIWIDTLKKQP